MTPEETRQAAAVMTAFAEGKRIEFLDNRGDYNEWQAITEPSWAWDAGIYRVTPERWAGKIWVRGESSCSVEDAGSDEYMEAKGWRLIEAKEVEP